MTNTVEDKLTAARTQLILDKPFLGALVLRLPLQAADAKWCPTTATDARRFYYNPDYVVQLNLQQLQFVLAHEALHCALSHFARRQHRHKFRWDIACDHAINPILEQDGLTPPPGVWVEKSFAGMTAEEIYPYIDENNSDEPMDRHVYENEENQSQKDQVNDLSAPSTEDCDPQGEQQLDETQRDDSFKGQHQSEEAGESTPQDNELAQTPPPLTETEKQTLQTQWQQRLAGAAQQALQAGKLGGEMARMVEHLLQPQLPWRMLLARYMSMKARDDYTYMRPSRREGEAILPSLRSAQLQLVVTVDISGSVSEEEIRQFLSEINALKGQMRAQIYLFACDAELAEGSPWLYEPWETFTPPFQLTGGGGTAFKPVFDYVEEQHLQPDLLIYFTDGEGEFPKTPPTYPVLWLIKGKKSVPWGQRIQLN